MRCPFCNSEDTQVKDSRPAEDASSIRRRRVCPDCGGRFTTFERVQPPDYAAPETPRPHVPFDRAKLSAALEIALRKRPVEGEPVDCVVDAILRNVESRGDSDVPSDKIGEL